MQRMSFCKWSNISTHLNCKNLWFSCHFVLSPACWTQNWLFSNVQNQNRRKYFATNFQKWANYTNGSEREQHGLSSAVCKGIWVRVSVVQEWAELRGGGGASHSWWFLFSYSVTLLQAHLLPRTVQRRQDARHSSWMQMHVWKKKKNSTRNKILYTNLLFGWIKPWSKNRSDMKNGEGLGGTEVYHNQLNRQNDPDI